MYCFAFSNGILRILAAVYREPLRDWENPGGIGANTKGIKPSVELAFLRFKFMVLVLTLPSQRLALAGVRIISGSQHGL